MCEIFPEVETCFGVISVRVGMVLIGILAITTGAVSLGVMEQRSNMNFALMMELYKNVSNYTKPEEPFSDVSKLISSVITLMSVVFMLAGLALLFSTFSDQEGFAQIFVWLVFVNICVGLLTLLAISGECTYMESECMLSGMDWLSASVSLLGMMSYLALWFYFCCVANSYVLNAYT